MYPFSFLYNKTKTERSTLPDLFLLNSDYIVVVFILVAIFKTTHKKNVVRSRKVFIRKHLNVIRSIEVFITSNLNDVHIRKISITRY